MTNNPFDTAEAMQSFILETVNEIADLVKALYHPKRLEILALMVSGQVDFSTLADNTGLQKSALGNHLSSLLDKNLVEKLDRGIYRITEDGQSLLSSIAKCYVNAKVSEQEKLESQRRRFQEMITKYTRYKYENGDLLDSLNSGTEQSEKKMKIEVKKMDALTVVGMKGRGSGADPVPFISPLFEGVHERFDELEDIISSKKMYGISFDIDKKTKEFSFLAGFEVKTGEIPENMTAYTLPSGQYAVVTCTMKTLAEAWKTAGRWIKNNGYVDISPPEFELYPEDHQEENDTMYIYVPIRKA